VQLETMSYAVAGPVGRITLNRPAVLNAMNVPWAGEFKQAADALAGAEGVRVVVIAGAGRAFSSGIDLKALARGEFPLDWFRTFEEGLRALERMDKVVIAAIHGYCIGGGLQVALASDIRVAATGTRFGLTAVKEGLVPGMGTFRLARYVGWGRAKRLILSGEVIGAEEAAGVGLVDHLVPEDEFEPRLEDIIARYLEASSSQGERESKRLLNEAFDLDWEAFLNRYIHAQARVLEGRALKIEQSGD
jgi:enoyl-CoA hydratase/carnithine racemase